MKDLNIKSFGLLIAYLLPGFACIFCFAFWIDSFKNLIDGFMSTNSDFGSFLFVLLLALLFGLILNAFRWIIYERWLLRKHTIPEDYYQELIKHDNLQAIHSTLDENFRYHQFYGNISIVFLGFFFEFIKRTFFNPPESSERHNILVIIAIGFLLVILELVIVSAAKQSFKRYVNRSKSILKGE
jgi:hypothetical protein